MDREAMAREVRLDLGRVDAEVGGECCQCPIGDVLYHRDRHEVVGDVSAVTEPVFGVGDVFAVHYTVRGQSVRWHWLGWFFVSGFGLQCGH